MHNAVTTKPKCYHLLYSGPSVGLSYTIGPAPFPDQRWYEVNKPGFTFLCLFCAAVFLFCVPDECFLSLVSFSQVLAKRMAGNSVSEMTYFVLVRV